MATSIKARLRSLIKNNKNHRRDSIVIAMASLLVVLGVAAALHTDGTAMTYEETVLDCPFAGVAAHTHEAACYDDNGNLVCPLPERALHAHTDECYDEEGNLICGEEEVTEEHIHGPGCFATVTVQVDDPEPEVEYIPEPEGEADVELVEEGVEMPARVFEGYIKDPDDVVLLKVEVEAPEGAVPADAAMKIESVAPNDIVGAVETAVAKESEAKVTNIQAVELTFVDAQDQKIDPAKQLTVTMTSNLVADYEEPLVVGVDEKGEGQVLETLDEKQLEKRDMKAEENQLVFDADKGETYGIVITTLEQVYEASDGGTYKIQVQVPETAGIPQDAQLVASELVPQTDEYEAYAQLTAEAIGDDAENLEHLRLFDISIVSAEGARLEPLAPVQVKIEYLGEAAGADSNYQVVHFADAGTEVLPVKATGNADGVDTFAFATNSFSVYAVVSSGQTTNLNGKTFALVSNGRALQSTASGNNRLGAIGVTVEQHSTKQYVTTSSGSVEQWTFEAAGNNTYYIKSSGGRYLNINNNSLTTSATPMALTVTANATAGTVQISNGNNRLNLYSNNQTSYWQRSTTATNITLYETYEVDDNFASYYGLKIGATELVDGDEIMIYKNVYNEKSGEYEDQIIAYDGTNVKAVKAYDKGDRLALKTDTSPFWKVTFCKYSGTDTYNGYYVLKNAAYPNICLIPQSDGTLQAAYVSDTESGITLNGRRDNKYNSTIEAWDGATFNYYGYQMTSSEESGVVLAVGTGEHSQEFSFARKTTVEEGRLHEVDTLNSKDQGITIKMWDFAGWKSGRGSAPYINSYEGDVNYLNNERANYGLVSNTLDSDGFPTFTETNKKASQLFDSAHCKGEANNLFLTSVYNSTGYYEYSAFNNFAHYNTSTGKFIVYEEIGTPKKDDQYFWRRGNFMPYNELNLNNPVTNEYDGSGKINLDYEDPFNDSTLYVTNTPNYYFGMTVEANFLMPENGRTDDGSPVVYEFNGDDDLWVYIDGVLVLDIGGVHDAISGSINFATGDVVVNSSNNHAHKNTTIRAMFKEANVFPDGTPWEESRANEYFNGNTFVDYGSHTFKMIYMEHGEGASNLNMRFNLPVIKEKTFTVAKQLDANAQTSYANVRYAYQVLHEDGTPFTSAEYEGTDTQVTFGTVEFNGQTYDNVFYLKPGEAASFSVPNNGIKYYVKELGIDPAIYNKVTANGVELTRNADGEYQTSVATVGNRGRVTYTNEPHEHALRIKKQLAPGVVNDGTQFEFRVQLENASGQLVPYSAGGYQIVDDDGNYYTYENGQLVNRGTTAVQASVSGNNGTILIPAGYTIIIPNLVPGTDFYVEEIRLPNGWTQTSKEVVAGTYEDSNLTGNAWADTGVGRAITADGAIIPTKDAQEIFTNAPNNKIKVNKVWASDDGFVNAHGPVNVALYTVDGSTLTLVEDSVKTITAPATSVEYAVTGNLDNYVVREVTVNGTTVTPVNEGGAIAVRGETTTLGEDATDTYLVSYTKGTAASGLRTDTITNTMPTITVIKTNADGSVVLPGAKFTLYESNGTTAVTGFTDLTSTGEGVLIDAKRLSNGTYYLVETKAPTGYNLLAHRIKVTVADNLASIYALEAEGVTPATQYRNVTTPANPLVYTFKVPNNAGEQLPNAGGPGTLPLTLAGAAIIAAALATLVLRSNGTQLRTKAK